MEEGRRLIIALPPGATIVLGEIVPQGKFALPLWLYWGEISRRHADHAKEHQPSDAMIDALSARLAGEKRKLPKEPERQGREETFSALIAVVAAAMAIDAFYGSIKPLVGPPPMVNASRHRQILECLKLGFRIGRHASRWQRELDWLFETRDNAVHHAEEFQPLVVVRTTGETVVAGGAETFNFSAESARRAADFATEVIQNCLDHPKPATEAWTAARRDDQRNIAGADSST